MDTAALRDALTVLHKERRAEAAATLLRPLARTTLGKRATADAVETLVSDFTLHAALDDGAPFLARLLELPDRKLLPAVRSELRRLRAERTRPGEHPGQAPFLLLPEEEWSLEERLLAAGSLKLLARELRAALPAQLFILLGLRLSGADAREAAVRAHFQPRNTYDAVELLEEALETFRLGHGWEKKGAGRRTSH